MMVYETLNNDDPIYSLFWFLEGRMPREVADWWNEIVSLSEIGTLPPSFMIMLASVFRNYKSFDSYGQQNDCSHSLWCKLDFALFSFPIVAPRNLNRNKSRKQRDAYDKDYFDIQNFDIRFHFPIILNPACTIGIVCTLRWWTRPDKQPSPSKWPWRGWWSTSSWTWPPPYTGLAARITRRLPRISLTRAGYKSGCLKNELHPVLNWISFIWP